MQLRERVLVLVLVLVLVRAWPLARAWVQVRGRSQAWVQAWVRAWVRARARPQVQVQALAWGRPRTQSQNQEQLPQENRIECKSAYRRAIEPRNSCRTSQSFPLLQLVGILILIGSKLPDQHYRPDKHDEATKKRSMPLASGTN